MKKIKKENIWWTGLTREHMKDIGKKKSNKNNISELWSDVYSDVARSPKKPKKPQSKKK